MPNKSIILSVFLSLASLLPQVNAEILSYGGYTHDTSTNIVQGNGFEWLQWDVTVGETIESIKPKLDILEGGGWLIASNTQMAELFNAFDFGMVFDSNENTTQEVSTGYTFPDTLDETDVMFIAMMGDTYSVTNSPRCWDNRHCYIESSAIFGTDEDGDGLYNIANVWDDYQVPFLGTAYIGAAKLGKDTRDSSYTNILNGNGIALVREVPAIPVPAAVWLFSSGLLGLISLARRNTAKTEVRTQFSLI